MSAIFTQQQLDAVLSAGDDLSGICHYASCTAGWWTDIATGQRMTDPTYMRQYRLVQEKIALIHSEVSEALEGYRKGKMDEHLPDRANIEVELADAVIRIADLAGAMRLDLGGAIRDKLVFNASRADHKIENRQKGDGKKF
jgi:NTP pyrophosphatase (non-canonical NTP hydrolase)